MVYGTKTSSVHPKVLIVGAGPTGLTHALALLRHGIPVRIIDKNVTPIPGRRGTGFHPRTFEILEALGVLHETWKLSRPIPEFRIYKMPGGTEIEKEARVAPFIDPTPSVPYPNIRSLGQNHLERILADAIQSQHGCSIDRGVDLKTFEQQEDLHSVRVTLLHQSGETEESNYSYLIGADGGKSIVRKMLGLPFPGETREERLFLGDFIMEGLDDDRVHNWGEMSDISLRAWPTEEPGLFTLILGGLKLDKYTKAEDPEEVIKTLLKLFIGGREDIRIKKTIWAGPYRFNIRMAPEFSKGRVFIAGDAAHVHSPTGGQGLNTGIHDSYNLAWKLALVLNNVASSSLLSTYSTERVPVVSEMLNITTQLMHKTLAANSGTAKWDRGGKLNQLGVNYRYSPIVVDGGEKDDSVQVTPYGGAPDDYVRAGDRAPDATGLLPIHYGGEPSTPQGTPQATRLFKIFDSRWHTVLVFADNKDSFKIDPHSSLLGKYSPSLVRFVIVHRSAPADGSIDTDSMVSSPIVQVFEDSQGHAYQAYRAPDGVSNVFVIRPDGYVGARVKVLGDIAGYLSGIFDRL